MAEVQSVSTPEVTIEAQPEGHTDEQQPASLVWTVWEGVTFAAFKVYRGMEYAGEILADMLGLTQSRYQWVLDEHNRREREKAERRMAEEKEEAKELDTLEGGGAASSSGVKNFSPAIEDHSEL